MRAEAFPDMARAFHEACRGRITSRLRLGFDQDDMARDKVDSWLQSHPNVFADPASVLEGLRGRTGEPCIIHAPGPSLARVAGEIPEHLPGGGRHATITVDGATRFFMETGRPFDAFVTDLDGMTPVDVDGALNAGHVGIIHAHGDNIEKLDAFLSRYENDDDRDLPVLFTTQAVPTDRVFNLGGFTDGDRALFVAIATGFTRVLLASMDVNDDTIGPYSKPGLAGQPLALHPAKRDKLAIATAVLRWVASRLPPGVVVATVNMTRPLPMFPNEWL